MSVNDRISKIIKFYNFNKNSFSKKLGLSNNTTIGNIVSGRKSKPSYTILERIVKNFPEINANWLLTGKGHMLLENPEEISETLRETKDYKEDKAFFELLLDEFSIDEIITYIHKYEKLREFDKNETYKMFLNIRMQRRIIAAYEENETRNHEE